MRSIVSDADGILGRQIAGRLLDAGHEVRGIGHAKATMPAGIRARGWPRRAGAFGRSLEGADLLVIADLGGPRGGTDIQSRLTGLIRAAAKAGVRRTVLISSVEVYDPAQLWSGCVDERGPFADPAPASDLGRLAAALERALIEAPGVMERVVLRVPMVLSRAEPGARRIVRGVLETGRAPGPEPRLHALDLDDLAEAAIRAGRVPEAAGHAFNIAGPHAISTESAVAEIGRLGEIFRDQSRTDVRVRPEYPPAGPALDTEKARAILGFAPRKRVWVNLAELVQACVHEMRAEGLLPPIQPRVPAPLLAIERRERPLAGKVAVVTGATSGLGREAALLLSRNGASVIATGRDRAAGAALVARMAARPETGPGRFIEADLLEPGGCLQLARSIAADHPAVDILLNVAGAMFSERGLTADGVERSFALNALAPFALTMSLTDQLRAAASAQVINVSAEEHQTVSVDLEDLARERFYHPVQAYGQAKFALVMLTYCMAARLREAVVGVHAFDPGKIRTDFARRNGLETPIDPTLGPQQMAAEQSRRDRALLQLGSPREAAARMIDITMSKAGAGGSGLYVVGEDIATSAPRTYDEAAAWALWRKCMELCKIEEAAE